MHDKKRNVAHAFILTSPGERVGFGSLSDSFIHKNANEGEYDSNRCWIKKRLLSKKLAELQTEALCLVRSGFKKTVRI